MTLVINLPGASGFKAQMVSPCSAVRVMVPVTLLVTLCSWRSLGMHEVTSAIPGIIQACSQGDYLLGDLSAEVAALDLFW